MRSLVASLATALALLVCVLSPGCGDTRNTATTPDQTTRRFLALATAYNRLFDRTNSRVFAKVQEQTRSCLGNDTTSEAAEFAEILYPYDLYFSTIYRPYHRMLEQMSELQVEAPVLRRLLRLSARVERGLEREARKPLPPLCPLLKAWDPADPLLWGNWIDSRGPFGWMDSARPIADAQTALVALGLSEDQAQTVVDALAKSTP